jgi:peptide/nickel transport system permease protein
MLRTIVTRVLLLIPVLILVSFGTFILVDLVPGDPAAQVLGPNSTPEEYQQIREQMGLDEPLLQRYWDWATDALQGDLGRNLVPPSQDVSKVLKDAFPVNIELAALALGMALIISIPLAMWSAYRAGSRFDRIMSSTMFGIISVPAFLSGIILLLLFAINWRVFPLGQWARPTDEGWATNLKHAFLPALTLALTEIAVFTRLLRSDMMATLQEDYILAAKAKGMPTAHILLREAFRPSSFSLLTLAGVSLGRLIGGTVIVEGLFSLPGVGRQVVDAARISDYKVVQGGVLIFALIYLLLNLIVDLVYAFLDPRIRRGRL